MPGSAVDWLVKVFGDGLTPEERKKFGVVLWRLIVSASLILAFFGWGPVGGFATAEDIDKKIAVAMQPVLEELRLMRQGLERNNEQQRQILIEGMGDKIRDMQRACMALQPGSPARARMAAIIEQSQIQYEDLTSTGRYKGTRYPIAQPCE